MRPLLKKFSTQFFPLSCLLCDLQSDTEHAICQSCFMTLPIAKSNCQQCGLPAHAADIFTLCGACLSNPPPFDRTTALFDYAAPISTLIWKLKFRGDLSIAHLFAKYWIDFIEKHDAKSALPDVIIPVPLHPTRLKQRGFNQAVEIAKPIGKYFQIPVDVRSCIRIRNTQTQSSLPAHQRKHNVTNAFALSHTIDAKHVVILDDVMTTGNTTSEISYLLKKVGVEKIDVWCCARASLMRSDHKYPAQNAHAHNDPPML